MTNRIVSTSPALDAAALPKLNKQVVQSPFDTLPNSGYMRQSQLIPDVVPFSPATLWRKCKSGDFPKPVKLSVRVTAWRVGDIRQFLETQAKVEA
jgi:predicted DNA-binding transcriptional regulator AlpA